MREAVLVQIAGGHEIPPITPGNTRKLASSAPFTPLTTFTFFITRAGARDVGIHHLDTEAQRRRRPCKCHQVLRDSAVGRSSCLLPTLIHPAGGGTGSGTWFLIGLTVRR